MYAERFMGQEHSYSIRAINQEASPIHLHPLPLPPSPLPLPLPTPVSAIACLQELVLHLICLLYMTTDALTDALTDVCTKCVFYVPDIMQAMYIYMGRYL